MHFCITAVSTIPPCLTNWVRQQDSNLHETSSAVPNNVYCCQHLNRIACRIRNAYLRLLCSEERPQSQILLLFELMLFWRGIRVPPSERKLDRLAWYCFTNAPKSRRNHILESNQCGPYNFAVARLWWRRRRVSIPHVLSVLPGSGRTHLPILPLLQKLDAFCRLALLPSWPSHACRCSCICEIRTHSHSSSVNIHLNLLYASHQLYG